MINLINGRVQSQGGMFVPNGSITFQLNMDAQVIAAPGGQVFSSQILTFQFDASGDLAPPARLYSNAELNPRTLLGLATYYLVTVYDANGAQLNDSAMAWIFPDPAGSTVDISTMTAYFFALA